VFRLATSPIAPLLGQRLPVRAQVRLMNRSYLRVQRNPGLAERVLTTRAGDRFQADLGSYQEWHRWVYGSLEDQMAQLFSRLVQPGSRCVVAGAGIGLHAVRLARLTGPTGEVIAVEPDPELARRAARNIALNDLANIRIIPAAASDASGRPAVADLAGSLPPVPSVTIDDTCPGPVALLEIAAAGRPATVVAGAAATIERDRPALVFDYAPESRAEQFQRPFGRLAAVGYLLYRISGRRNSLTGRCSLRLDPLYAEPETGARLLAVSEDDAPRIISLVGYRDGRV
jgi:FkbM family methyltransferase